MCAAWIKPRSLSQTKKKQKQNPPKKTQGLLLWERVACVLLCLRLSPSFQVIPVDRMPAEQWPVRCLTRRTRAFWLTHITGTWREFYTPNTHTHIYKVMSPWFMYFRDSGEGPKGSTHTVILPERPTRTFTYDGWSATEADIISIFMITDESECTTCRNKQSREAVSYLHVN